MANTRQMYLFYTRCSALGWTVTLVPITISICPFSFSFFFFFLSFSFFSFNYPSSPNKNIDQLETGCCFVDSRQQATLAFLTDAVN